MTFDNSILRELSEQGKKYLSYNLNTFLSKLDTKEKENTSVGLSIKIDNPTIVIDSPSSAVEKDKLHRSLSVKIYFAVTSSNIIKDEFELEPDHLNNESFANLEKILSSQNMFWYGSSMFINFE